MGDFVGIIALLVLYIVASSMSMGKKKKNAENSEKKDVQKKQTVAKSAQQNKRSSQKKKAEKPSKTNSQPKQVADTNQSLAPDFPEIQVQSQAFENHDDPDDQERRAFAEDIMRGVIMNEILTRPNEREAIRRMRQRR